MLRLLLLASLAAACAAECPMFGTPPEGHPPIVLPHIPRDVGYLEDYLAALDEIDFAAVKTDITAALSEENSIWPFDDVKSYGPLLIRLASNCAGSYRESDGRGGCDGANIRFEPELSWADNTNLEKARMLLKPIKEKYGLGLSWGDLIVLAGNTAVEAMGGPASGFCGGRVDSADGGETDMLGPSEAQQKAYPCVEAGNCQAPLGTTEMGMVYVNPGGPMGDATKTQEMADQIRRVFGLKNFNDEETVALIGGGHTFGRAHGPCPAGAGPPPSENVNSPWPGLCLEGHYTSGYHGAWTETPLVWNNDYFKNLETHSWMHYAGPSGKHQWKINSTETDLPEIMMLTSDIALKTDEKYHAIVKQFSEDQTALDEAFKQAWYKFMTQDMGPHARCVGEDVGADVTDDEVEWKTQSRVEPKNARSQPNAESVKDQVRSVMATVVEDVEPDTFGGSDDYGATFIYLAYRCAATYRQSDFLGGCDGAYIRFPPESDWDVNEGLLDVMEKILKPVYDHFEGFLSWADLITYAGITALEDMGSEPIEFCGFLGDAPNGRTQDRLDWSGQGNNLREWMELTGLEPRDVVALRAMPRSMMSLERAGYTGSWSEETQMLSTDFYKVLMAEKWLPFVSNGKQQYKADKKPLYMLVEDMHILWDPEFYAIAEQFVGDEEEFKAAFSLAWSKLINLGRLAAPSEWDKIGMEEAEEPPEEEEITTSAASVGSTVEMVAAVFMAAVAVVCSSRC